MSDLSHRFGAFSTRVISSLLFNVTIRGLEHIPREGAALVMCNHISHLDPNILGMSFPLRGRCIDYMADLPLLKIPIVGALLKSWNAFPVDRTKPVDRAAIRTALERLANGRLVGIFPEKGLRYGERSILNGAELPVGTAALWQMGKVPALPALVYGTDQLYQWRNLFRRPRLFVYFGPMLPPPAEGETRETARDRLVAAIRSLYEQLQRDFELKPCEVPRCPQDRWKEK